MKNLTLTPYIEKIQRLSPSLGSVFSYADLFNLIGSKIPLKNARTIQRLLREEVIFKVCRGFYITKNPDLWTLACRLRKETYISMDSVLAKNGLVGTLPEKSVSAISPCGLKQTLQTPFGVIRFFSIQRTLLGYGISVEKNGIRVANNERAYLDLLYYYLKGVRFVFDPLREVNIKKLNLKKMNQYLKNYKNKKFVRFVKGLIDEVD